MQFTVPFTAAPLQGRGIALPADNSGAEKPETGNHEELRKKQGSYYALCMTQLACGRT